MAKTKNSELDLDGAEPLSSWVITALEPVSVAVISDAVMSTANVCTSVQSSMKWIAVTKTLQLGY